MLVEDDNVTEKFRQGQIQTTRMELLDGKKQFIVYPAEGSCDGAVQQKNYTLNVTALMRLRH
jgi:hypothetical protein